MNEWNEFAASLFSYGVLLAGSLAVLALVLWAIAWSLVQLFKWLKVWHVLCLAVSVRLHGKKFADNQFWWAIKERVDGREWKAKSIADYAMRCVKQEADKENAN